MVLILRDDLMARREFVIGTTAKGSNAYVNGAILQRILGAPVRQIAGYPGSNEERLAVERGELDGGCGSWSALPPDWIANHRINPHHPQRSFSERGHQTAGPHPAPNVRPSEHRPCAATDRPLRSPGRTPRYRSGAHRIALVLATGEVIDDVIVAGDEVIRVAGKEPRAVPLHAVTDVIDRSAG